VQRPATGTHFIAERAKVFGFLFELANIPKALAASATMIPFQSDRHRVSGSDEDRTTLPLGQLQWWHTSESGQFFRTGYACPLVALPKVAGPFRILKYSHWQRHPCYRCLCVGGCLLSRTDRDDSFDETQSAPATSGTARLMVERGCVQWERDLKAFLLGVLRDSHLAEDVFQKAVIRAIASAKSVRQETLKGWLFAIALNEARQSQREKLRDTRQHEQLAEQLALEQPQRLAGVDVRWITELGLVNSDVVDVLRVSVARLPKEMQQVIGQRIYEGRTFAEIAAEMELPLGTVLTWMRRGLQKLREDSGLRDLWDQ